MNINQKFYVFGFSVLLVGILIYQVNLHNKITRILETQSNQNSAVSKDLEQRLAKIEADLKRIDGIFKAGFSVPLGEDQEDYSQVYDIPVAHTPVVGNKEAPVTIVEFVDFECPFCARYYSALPDLVKQFPDKVNYMIKNFPLTFQGQAVPAAKAAFAAGEQGKYAEMVQALFDHRKELAAEKYLQLAKELGLDVEKFKQDLTDKDKIYDEYIKADLLLGTKLGVKGTPTFFMNGKRTAARDLPSFMREIETLLNPPSAEKI